MARRIVRLASLERERQELVRLERFLTALVARAIGAYAGEPIGDGSVIADAAELAAAWVRWCADAGAFRFFKVRDALDLVELPPLLEHGFPPGVMYATVTGAALAIAAGGTRRVWVEPRDLAMAVAAR